jgi:hypothetical protein
MIAQKHFVHIQTVKYSGYINNLEDSKCKTHQV